MFLWKGVPQVLILHKGNRSAKILVVKETNGMLSIWYQFFLAGQFFSRKNWVNCPKTMSFRIYYLKFVDFFYFPTQLLWLEAMVYLLSIKSYFSNNRPSRLSWSESPVSYQLSYQDFLVNLSFYFDSNGLEVKTKNCSKVAPFT